MRAADNPDVAKVCHAIKTLSSVDQALASRLAKNAHGKTQGGPPLPWPPLPHDLLGVDILAPPFSSHPAENNYVAWQETLETTTAAALEYWLRPGVGDKEIHDAAEIASLCLRRPELLLAYRGVVRSLTEGWLPWTHTVTRDSKTRWMVLGDVCGWVGQGEVGSDGSGLGM
ncbi:uncharacterized protein B0H64DRAFT_446419 [Chaetomium fimeti]|uniref:Uncharacterized protein n=1 Tax=Chaetomium fimeti TaxID=1854472 RepID=A0AAE0LMS9_9PEZI|nr:hypothetical protein B0H64DRAFT_446419 [Chaetomium fimeti]